MTAGCQRDTFLDDSQMTTIKVLYNDMHRIFCKNLYNTGDKFFFKSIKKKKKTINKKIFKFVMI